MVFIYKILQSKIIATLFTVFTFILYTLPSNSFNNIPTISDKLIHCILFMAVTLLWLFSSKSVYWVISLCIFYGIFVELCQMALPEHFHRSGDWKDVLFDTLGVAIAGLVFYFLKKSKYLVFPR